MMKGLACSLSVARFARRVHADERGTISIVTVFALFVFTMLLGMVVNVGRHVDDKLRMQNAADAAAYTGGVVVARGMNTLAFTNHLEAEIFALTAYMRTANEWGQDREQNEDLVIRPILDAWERIGPVFQQHGGEAGFEKFERLGRAIQDKVPLERDMVSTFGEMSYEHSALTLPVLESILRGPEAAPGSAPDPLGGYIPRYQRAIVQMTPAMAERAVNEVAGRHGRRTERQHRRQPLRGLLWRTDVQPLGMVDEFDPLRRTLPALDPSPMGPEGDPLGQVETARSQRESLARHYLELWIRDWMGPYFSYNGSSPAPPGRDTAKMSQFINFWRIFACGHLMRLLNEEYPVTNLPHVIRPNVGGLSQNQHLELDHQFVSVVYWPQMSEMLPGLFRNPLDRQADKQVFAQVMVFLPARRYVRINGEWGYWYSVTLPNGEIQWRFHSHTDNWPTGWNLLNQNWMTQLVPATSASVGPILQQPNVPGIAGFRPPNLSGAGTDDLRRVNTH